MLVVLGTITDAPATLINVIHDLNAAQLLNGSLEKADQH